MRTVSGEEAPQHLISGLTWSLSWPRICALPKLFTSAGKCRTTTISKGSERNQPGSWKDDKSGISLTITLVGSPSFVPGSSERESWDEGLTFVDQDMLWLCCLYTQQMRRLHTINEHVPHNPLLSMPSFKRCVLRSL
jgi:hypothetical protein